MFEIRIGIYKTLIDKLYFKNNDTNVIASQIPIQNVL